jgi:prepilin-type N-terminal cleavage/methylation domain-containing protein
MYRNTNSQGFTLLEVMIAMVILVIGIVGVASAVVSSINLQQHTREMSLAMGAARRQLANLEYCALTNGLNLTWFQFRDGTAGRFFNADYDETDDYEYSSTYNTVVTRRPLTAMPDNPLDLGGNPSVGWIDFPPVNGPGLDETAVMPDLGMPSDLDSSTDTVIALSSNLTWLPVRITLRWKSHMGRRVEIAGQPYNVMEWKLCSGLRKPYVRY